MDFYNGNTKARRRHHDTTSAARQPTSTSTPSIPLYHAGSENPPKRSGRIAYKTQKLPRSPTAEAKYSRLIFRILFIGAVIVVIVYGALFLHINRLLTRGDQVADTTPGLYSDRTGFDHFHSDRLPVHSDAAKQNLDYYSSERFTSSGKAIKDRHEARRTRTRPPSWGASANDIVEYNAVVKPYEFEFLQEMETNLGDLKTHTDTKDNDAQDSLTRCGINTQNAFLANPLLYPDMHSVNKDSVVLITGILGRLGFHLALKLATQCNVKVMIGVDPLFPNESVHKLQLLEQISILYTQVSEFKRPLIMAFDGVNPLPRYHTSFKGAKFMNGMSGDFDYSAYVSPTHVVHLLSAEEHAYLSIDAALDSGGLFGLRQSLVATEQLLTNLGTSHLHFTFVSDVDVLSLASSNADGNHDSQMKQTHRGMHTATKLMEEILMQPYAENLDDYTFVTLRMPALYGPWGKIGDFDHDLAKKAVTHWHDKGTMDRDLDSNESMLLQLTDQSELSQVEHDVMFVDGKLMVILYWVRWYLLSSYTQLTLLPLYMKMLLMQL